MDFEQALKAGGTVVLEEGRRLESLGLTSSSTPLGNGGESSSGRSSSRPGSSSSRQQPATPTIVPPTPESTFQRVSPAEKQRNAAQEKSRLPVQSETPQSTTTTTTAKAGGPLASSPTIIGGVPFQQSGEKEVQSKRRSLFRNSGTASSPDLAALMRKGKERGGVGGVDQASSNGSARTTYQQQQQYQDSATQNSSNHLSPPVVIGGGGGGASSQPSSASNSAASQYQQDPHARQRTRSSTSSSFSVISSPSLSDAPPPPPAAHVKSRGKMAKAEKVLGVTGQGIGSHSAFDNGWSNTERAPKQTIRSKTSALWGKVTGTTRQRGLSSASSTVPNTPITPNSATSNAFTQPSGTPSFSVSPPPAHTTARSPYGARSTTLRDDLFTSPKAASSTNLTKPLPPIYPGSFGEDDGRGTLKAGKGKAKAPTMPPVSGGGGRGNRRRSMSVDAMDLKQILAMGGRISSEINLEKAHPSLPPRAELESNDGHSLLSGWNLSTAGGLDDFRGSFAGLTGPPSSSDGHSTKPKPARPRALTTELPPPELVPPGSARSENSNSVPSTPYLSTDAIAINTSYGSNVSAATAKPPSEREARYSSDVTAMPSEPEISDLSASESSKPPTRRGSMRSSPGLPPGAAAPRLYGSSLHAPSDTSRPNAMSSSEPSLVPQRSSFARRGSADVISPQQSAGGSLQVSIDSPPQNRTMRPGTASSRQFRMNSDPGSGLEVSVFEYGGDGAISSPAIASEDDVAARAKSLADRCWREDETFKAREKIAEWLGGSGTLNKQALSLYVDHFDFKGYRLDNAFRHLCGKLYLKAETQQVDRILEQFGRRYWDCNPGNLFGNPSVVHSVAYSLLLLNTDLHIADIASHMSRGQFVRNTLFAITESARSSSPTSAAHPSLNPAARASTPDLPSHSEEVSRRQSGETSDPTTLRMKSKRSGSITSWKSGSREAVGGMLGNASTPALLSSSAVNHPNGASSNDTSKPSTPIARGPPLFSRSWEVEMENLLKDMYNAIKERQILQPTSSMERSSMSSLTPGSTLVGRSRSQRRNGSTNALKRGSIRGIQTLLGSQSPYSSNSSSTDGRVSPSPSFATSFGDAVSASSSSLFAPTLGFASNLSHTIIKEAQEDDVHSIDSVDTADTSVSITDEELALQGAPWAKEGMLCRKQYWESTGKRAKDKSWMDVFVVIQKGTLNMFTFGEMTAAASRGGGVGGGNWLANATPMGTVNLAHSLAHVLPPPGYNRSRPHCFVLTVSTDAVYFFQAGTEDLVNEWVSTCNYWAARTSKEPLQGGVSNMEYGWSKVEQTQNNPHANNSVDNSDAYSDVFSVRSGRSKISKRSFDVLGSARSNYSPFAMEKIFINDWKAPIHSTIPSTHDEEAQMEALQKQVSILKLELSAHDKIQVPMQNMYQPRSPNFMKAMGNWEARSKYLLAEVFKYETYVDCLRDAMSLRLKKRGEKVLERALDSGAEGEAFTGLSLRPSRRGLREETIQEAEEPLTPGPTSAFSQHTRETATNS